jgi:ABC-type glycerol-3-phosphate transport system permease component
MIESIKQSNASRQKISKVMIVALLTLISVIIIVPFAWMISTSLKPDVTAVYTFPPEWIPKPATWSNYLDAWNAAPFDRYLVNSLIVSISGMILQVTNACLCAYVFARIQFPGRDAIFLLFLAVLMIPSQVTVVPNYVILSNLKWIDTYWALIVPTAATAFGTFLVRQSFLAVPDELIDAAILDGAGHLKILRHVMIPLSIPMIITLALLVFNWRWNDYFWVLIMTNSDRMRTLPVGLVAMRAGSEGGSQWQILMAATVIVIAPVMIIFAFAQKYFIQGISRTGLK